MKQKIAYLFWANSVVSAFNFSDKESIHWEVCGTLLMISISGREHFADARSVLISDDPEIAYDPQDHLELLTVEHRQWLDERPEYTYEDARERVIEAIATGNVIRPETIN